MKVFISWSGEDSLKVAKILKEWIPCVIQGIEPYLSSNDIDKGARWSSDIAKQLEEATFGILCITKENLDSAWLNFEAGALSKAMDTARVCPLLFGLKPSEISTGPILQFQMTSVSEADIYSLFVTMNKCMGDKCLTEEMLKKMFDMCWPKIKSSIENIPIKNNAKTNNVTNQKDSNQILEEILNLVRNQQIILRSPENILPFDYLKAIFDQNPVNRAMRVSQSAILDYVLLTEKIKSLLSEIGTNEIIDQFMKLQTVTEYILRKAGCDIKNITDSRIERKEYESSDTKLPKLKQVTFFDRVSESTKLDLGEK